MADMIEILKTAVAAGASDIHMVIGKPPMMRLNGEIREISNFPALDAESSKNAIYSVLFESQKMKFEENWELDCSIGISGVARFRINVFNQVNGVEAVMRVISNKIPAPGEIGLTQAMMNLSELPRGLVLVTGPTGSGKSTTLACILELINQREACNILTIEDPVEFAYASKKSVFRQREVGQNTKSFSNALRSALRQDPDVILVGEMRDLETIQLAITAAETGHLCFGTLHTQDAPSTIDRIIDVFPPHQQTQVRVQLAAALQGVIAQNLIPRKDGRGRVAARELLINTPAVANLIREGKTHMIYNAIETGGKYGMVTMDKCLASMVRTGQITMEDAISKVHDIDSFKKLVEMMGDNSIKILV